MARRRGLRVQALGERRTSRRPGAASLTDAVAIRGDEDRGQIVESGCRRRLDGLGDHAAMESRTLRAGMRVGVTRAVACGVGEVMPEVSTRGERQHGDHHDAQGTEPAVPEVVLTRLHGDGFSHAGFGARNPGGPRRVDCPSAPEIIYGLLKTPLVCLSTHAFPWLSPVSHAPSPPHLGCIDMANGR